MPEEGYRTDTLRNYAKRCQGVICGFACEKAMPVKYERQRAAYCAVAREVGPGVGTKV